MYKGIQRVYFKEKLIVSIALSQGLSRTTIAFTGVKPGRIAGEAVKLAEAALEHARPGQATGHLESEALPVLERPFITGVKYTKRDLRGLKESQNPHENASGKAIEDMQKHGLNTDHIKLTQQGTISDVDRIKAAKEVDHKLHEGEITKKDAVRLKRTIAHSGNSDHSVVTEHHDTATETVATGAETAGQVGKQAAKTVFQQGREFMGTHAPEHTGSLIEHAAPEVVKDVLPEILNDTLSEAAGPLVQIGLAIKDAATGKSGRAVARLLEQTPKEAAAHAAGIATQAAIPIPGVGYAIGYFGAKIAWVFGRNKITK